MASFAISNTLCITKLGSSSSLRSEEFVRVCSLSAPAPIRRYRHLRHTVKASGTVKYKGTQMKEQQLAELIEKKVIEAKKACEEDLKSDGCKVAWDEVEEVSQAKADLRKRLEKEDPLEYFCNEHPETDECRIYED